jgi:hypothetical protein
MNKEDTFYKTYKSIRKEWPDGVKPFTRTFRDERKERRDKKHKVDYRRMDLNDLEKD